LSYAEVVQAIFGPLGALALALLGLYILGRILLVLWREHLKADDEDRAQRDRAEAREAETKELLRQSLSNNADSITSWNRRNELDANRQRRADGNRQGHI